MVWCYFTFSSIQSWDTFPPKAPAADGAPVSGSQPTGSTNVSQVLLKKNTTSMVFGRQLKAIQGMLDFDYVCRRDRPSVACMIDPFNSAPRKDFYWGSKQVFIPSKKPR